MASTHRQIGFTLTELMIAMVISTMVITGVFSYFAVNKRITHAESISSGVEATLRIATARVSDRMRYAGYGVPENNLSLWVPWVANYNTNPKVRLGVDTEPDAIDIAKCSETAVTALSATAVAGSKKLNVDDISFFNAVQKQLIYIGGREHALITHTSGFLSIDTDPVTFDNQGLEHTYYAGTPVCRVDVTSYEVDSTNKQFVVNKNHGGDAVPLLYGITDLQITTIDPATKYQLEITASSTDIYPGITTPLSRSTSTLVTVRH